MRMRAFGSAEPETKSEEARSIGIALAEAFEQPVCLILRHLAGSDRLVDLRGELRISGCLDGSLYRLQISAFLGNDGSQGLAALQLRRKISRSHAERLGSRIQYGPTKISSACSACFGLQGRRT